MGNQGKYCECKGRLIIANLKSGKGKCPLCNLPKKLSQRLNRMSKIFKTKWKIKNLI